MSYASPEQFNLLEKYIAERNALYDAALEALELIEGYIDVVDGDYGIPAPNKAMKAYSILKDAVEKIECPKAENQSLYGEIQ